MSAAVLAAALAGCSSDDGVATDQETPAEQETPADQDAADQGAVEEDAAAGNEAAADLVGIWRSDTPGLNYTWRVTEDTITASIGVGTVGSTYTATKTNLELVDESGQMACPSDQIGTYEWDVTDDVLSLTAVSDECDGRRGTLDGSTWERIG